MKKKCDKKNFYMTLFTTLVMLVLVAGATYAYFSVAVTNNFGTRTVTAEAGSIGSVTLNGNNATLNMDLSASDMASNNTGTYYAGNPNKVKNTENIVTLGTASVSPNTDTNYYHCTYTLSVTHTGTVDMYNKFNHQTNNTYDYTNRSTGQIALIVNGTEYDWASTNGMPSTINGEFYIQGNETVNITAGLKFVNTITDQSYMAGTDISITIGIVDNSFTCSAEEVPEVVANNLYFQLPPDWYGTDVYVYMFDKNDSSAKNYDYSNPSNEYKAVEEDSAKHIYKYAIPVGTNISSYNTIIFNNGDYRHTVDFPLSSSNIGQIFVPELYSSNDNIRLFIKDSAFPNTDLYVFYWGGGGSLTYPGQKLLPADKINNKAYKAIIGKSNTNFLVNNDGGGYQTGDVTIKKYQDLTYVFNNGSFTASYFRRFYDGSWHDYNTWISTEYTTWYNEDYQNFLSAKSALNYQ